MWQALRHRDVLLLTQAISLIGAVLYAVLTGAHSITLPIVMTLAAVLGVNRAAGVTRISPAEAAAANLPGGYVERFNAWADKASTGKLSPQLASEGKQLMNIVIQAAHQKAVQESQYTAAQRGIPASNAIALSLTGKLTTLDKLSTSPQYGTKNGKRVVSYDGGKTNQPAE